MDISILLLNGPNLNLLGLREPTVYGATSLADIVEQCQREAALLDIRVDARQSNHEGDLISWVQDARGEYDGIIINPGGLTHSSVSLRDALVYTELPVVEVHLSNIFAREPFRHHSYISDIALGGIFGLGARGYVLALEALCLHLRTQHAGRQG